MRSISILGSTGSIGCNTLKVVDHLGDIRVVAMAAGRNVAKFAEQIAKYAPELVSCCDDASAAELERELHALGASIPRVEVGEKGLVAVAEHEQADTVVSATVGAVGFVPTLRAIEAGKRIALANKETLVMAAAGGQLLEDLLEFLLEHGLEALAADVAFGFSIERIADAHVIGRDGFGNRAGRAADGEEPARHLLSAADLGESSVGGGIEIELQGFLPGAVG